MGIFYEYLFFSQSFDGQTCLAEMRAARALTATDHQAAYSSFCSGTCYTQLSDFAARLFAADCGAWPAYLELQRDLDLMCSQVRLNPLQQCNSACVREYR